MHIWTLFTKVTLTPIFSIVIDSGWELFKAMDGPKKSKESLNSLNYDTIELSLVIP